MKSSTSLYRLPQITSAYPKREVQVTFLWNDLVHKLAYYINGTRNSKGIYNQLNLKEQYYMQLSEMVDALVSGLGAFQPNAVLLPPTRRDHALALKDRFLPHFAQAVDLTSAIRKKNEALRLGSMHHLTAPEMLKNYDYTAMQDLRITRNLLLVDDVVRQGRTIAAILALLHKNGLPSDCQVRAVSLICFADHDRCCDAT